MALWSLMEMLLAFVLLTPPASLAPARVVTLGMTFAHARMGDKAPAAPARDDAYLVHLDQVEGTKASGRILACRVRTEWKPGTECTTEPLSGQELRVFTGSGGEIARWKVTAGGGAVAPTPGATGPPVSGELTAPLANISKDDPLAVPFAVLGSPRHALETPRTDGVGPERLARMLEASRVSMRMHPQMSEGMVTSQFAVGDLAPYLLDAIVTAGSNYADGPLDKAPRPTASFLAIHAQDEGATSGVSPIRLAIQVISMPTDERRFERFRLAAVIDFDGDGWRELLVRGRSERGDRYRLFELTDKKRARPLTPWIGAWQPASAPRLKKGELVAPVLEPAPVPASTPAP